MYSFFHLKKSMRTAVIVVVSLLLAMSLLISVVPAGKAYAAISGKYTPQGNEILLIVGQTSEGIGDYLNSFNDAPYGVTLYTNPNMETTGFSLPGGGKSTQPGWYSSGYGSQSLDYILNTSKLDDSAIAVGIWMGEAIETDIAYGESVQRDSLFGPYSGTEMKQNLASIITDLKATDRPIFLRLGYEADGYWNGYYPEAYKMVWQYVKEEIDRQGANNIATVWQLAAHCEPFGSGSPLVASDPTGKYSNGVRSVVPTDYDVWYPGDEYVDWTGISIFNQGTDCQTGGKQGYDVLQDVVDYLAAKGKPILVAESTPRGYDYNAANGTYTYEQAGQPKRTGLSGQTVWDEWYEPYFDFIEANRDAIRGIAYINDDWEMFSHWACSTDSNGGVQSGCAEGNWGNARVDVNQTIQANWTQRVINSGNYVLAGGAVNPNPDPDPNPVPDTTPPSQVSGLSVTGATHDSISLTWNPATDNVGVTGYRVYNNANDQIVATTAGATSATVNNLDSDTSYSFYAKALDAASNVSIQKSNVATGTTESESSQPNPAGYTTGVQNNGDGTVTFWIDADSSQVYLHWNTGTSQFDVDVPVQQINQNNYGIANQTNGRFEKTASITDGTWVSFYFNYISDGVQHDTTSTVFQQGGGVVNPPDPEDPEDPPGSGALDAPGIIATDVGAIANESSKSWDVNVTQSGMRAVKVSSTSSQNSQLIDISFNGQTLTQAIDAGSTITAYFNNTSLGNQTLTITAKSGAVSIGQVEIQ